jgi:hypothetical protein
VTTVLDHHWVAAPGVYDMPDHVYHADPVPGGSLSSTGVRKLLPPSCPALFRHWLDNGEAPKSEFDFGHAAHRRVLGIGAELVEVKAKDWRTNAAKAAAEQARAEGKVPLLTADLEHVAAMAAALRQHPIARALLDPDRGRPEQSLFWVDETGVWCRARLDWLPDPHGGRVILTDYKTTTCASSEHLSKEVGNYGYYMQDAFYLAGAQALGLAGDDAAFVFVCQEKTAPYLVNIVELDSTALAIGRRRNRQAIDLYAECTATGQWPGYSTDIELISLPSWVERRFGDD